jgi:hypothetical protein
MKFPNIEVPRSLTRLLALTLVTSAIVASAFGGIVTGLHLFGTEGGTIIDTVIFGASASVLTLAGFRLLRGAFRRLRSWRNPKARAYSPDSRLGTLVTLTGLAVAGVAAVSGYNAVERLIAGDGSKLVVGALAGALLVGLGVAGRRWLSSLGGGFVAVVAGLLGFPVTFIRQQWWWVYFGVTGGACAFACYQLSGQVSGNLYQNVLYVSGALLAAGLVYHLHRHKWGDAIALLLLVPLAPVGVYLLTFNTAQVEKYNEFIALKQDSEGRKDLEGHVKLLEASQQAFERERQRGQLYKLIFGEPPTALAARVEFQRGNAFAQMPNKGKETHEAYEKSLGLNPGHMFNGLADSERSLRYDDALNVQRNLEKIIRTGQDGGRGTPNQPGQPGQQGQQPQDKRDPGRQPRPGSGRHPDNIL